MEQWKKVAWSDEQPGACASFPWGTDGSREDALWEEGWQVEEVLFSGQCLAGKPWVLVTCYFDHQPRDYFRPLHDTAIP